MIGIIRIMLVLGILVNLCLLQYGFSQECNVSIRRDLYFSSMTEMAGEKAFPEVVILENEEISVWSVPNRGRLIFDVIRKETGHSQLVANRTPLPLRFRGLYTFEFGGIYTTFPWHKRDNVPLPLEMEVVEDKTCVLRMWSTDPGTNITLIAELLLQAGPEIKLTLQLKNSRPVEQNINFGLVLLARPGASMSQDTELFIPVESIIVGESEGRWMGEIGSKIPWPAPWYKWGNFVKAGSFYIDIKAMQSPFIAIHNPVANETLRLSWSLECPWTTCEIFSWGQAYGGVMGAYEGFRVELKADNLTIPSMGEQVLEVQVIAEKGRM